MVADEQGRLPLPWLAEPLAAALNQPAHALLVVGSPGVGALAFQLSLAQAWLCEAGPPRQPLPCGDCASCRLVRARTHPDLFVMLPEVLRVDIGWEAVEAAADGTSGKRKPSRQVRIGEVRAATDWIVKTTSRGRAKVLVLHPAEAMNPQSANALLKTLEEPPPGARLLLSCSDPERLLPTVRSRCQRLLLPAPPPALAEAWLQEQGVDAADAPVLLNACSARPLDALALSKAGVDAAAWTALPRALAAGRAEALAGWTLPQAVDALQKLCHDAMAGATGGQARYFAPDAVPAGADLATLAQWSRQLVEAARSDEHPLNDALQIESLVLSGRQAWAKRSAGRSGGGSGGSSASSNTGRFATLRP